MNPPPAGLIESLVAVHGVMAAACNRWAVIGSAALWLHGIEPGPIGDVDIMLSVADARRLAHLHRLPFAAGPPSARFRSTLFARWPDPPLSVEFMAGLHLATADRWTPIRMPPTQLAVVGTCAVPVAELAGLATLLRRFDRPQDRARLALLA